MDPIVTPTSMRDQMVVICAVNDEGTLKRDLMASPIVDSGSVPIFTFKGAKTAGEAYNAGIEATKEEYMIFAHQDVYLPRGWDSELSRHIEMLERDGLRWGVLGCFGVTSTGQLVGTVWSSGLGRELKHETRKPVAVRSLDELILIVRRSSNLRFDALLPSFHLYGTDIVLAAARAGYGSYAINAPVIHNSKPVLGLDHGYRTAFGYMCHKWSKELPVRTPICVLSKNRLSLLRTHFGVTRSHLLRRLQGRSLNRPVANPSHQAQQLGYERPPGA